jgi:hypothetical protein
MKIAQSTKNLSAQPLGMIKKKIKQLSIPQNISKLHLLKTKRRNSFGSLN